jgi:stage III sporulation protein AD
MEVFQIVAIGLVATIFIIILKQYKPEYGILVSIITGIIIFILIIEKLHFVVQVLENLASRANINYTYFTTIIKIIGVAYIIEFGSQISRDAGEESIASKIELGGKVIIMVMSIPIMISVMDLIIRILP